MFSLKSGELPGPAGQLDLFRSFALGNFRELLGDGPNGVKRFKVRYARETSEWGLSLGTDGKINGLTVTD